MADPDDPPAPTLEDLLAADMLAWLNPDGSGSIRARDTLTRSQIAHALRHLADHVDPDVIAMPHHHEEDTLP